jgi:hypothetical protein
MALVNQQLAANGGKSAGFINPAIYDIAAGANYASCFHDVTSGNNTWSESPNLFYAMPNYDLCTGLGTMNGTNLINALSTPWPDATSLGNGWMSSSWFGVFNVTYYPWIYHVQHGWLYVLGTDPNSIWLWTPDTVVPWTGFLWTGSGDYPWLWSDTQQTWLYYDVGSSNPRYFFNWKAQKWVPVNP